jgi:phospho-N-acetylmuramoyl-pentapeptide-transferase
MLYHLFEFLEKSYNLPGAGLFQFITFRSASALILSLVISILIGDKIISSLKRLQIGETVRELGLDGQKQKEGTPTMGGIIIILAILIPCLLFAKLNNIYIILMVITTLWMGVIGGLDDYIKVFKKNKDGLSGKFKIYGQIVLGVIIGFTMLLHEDIVIRVPSEIAIENNLEIQKEFTVQPYQLDNNDAQVKMAYVKASWTNVPFLKNNSLDYKSFLFFLGDNASNFIWLIFVPIVILIVTSVSNGANLTDGIDGLLAGVAAIIAATLGVFAYVSGNSIIANYLNIFYIPFSEELVVFSACLIGACVGFLWYNSFPAKVFMGDTGSLTLGAIIAVLALLLRKELLIPLLCGIFLIENLSVVLQVSYFKYTRKKYGEGRRIFLMSPLHHHYQKKGIHEAKIVTRFWIIGILLAILSIITLKLR